MNKFALIPILLICINTNLPWLSSVNGFIHVHNTELVYTGQTYIGVKLIIQDCNGCVISNNTFTDYNGIASVALEIINSQNIIIGNNTFTRLNAFTNSETYAIKIINSVNVTIDQNVISEINNNVITNLVFLYNSSNILISDNLIENIISLKLNSFRIQESYNITLESNIILNTTTNYFINKISGTDKLLFINNSFNINSTNAECLYIQHSNNINFTLNNMVINQNEVMNMSFIGQSTNFRMNNNTISTDGDFSIGIIDQSENGLIELNQIITLNYTNYSLYNNKDVFISENNLDLNGELLNISKKVEILSYDPNMIFDFNIDSDSKRYNVTWFITNITGNFSIYFDNILKRHNSTSNDTIIVASIFYYSYIREGWHNITLELTDEYGNHWFSMGLLNLTRIELHQNSSDFINSKDEIKLDLRLITLLGLVLLILIVYKIELETLFISKSIIKINKKTRIGINKLQNRLKKD